MKELIKIEDGFLVKETIDKIIEIESKLNELKELESSMKEQLKGAMEEKNITKFDTPELMVFIKETTTRETFDSKKFKEDYPDLYDEYVNISNVKGSITIKVK